MACVETAAFQRLRYVRQLGHAFLVYPGATHSRFEHALGAYHLARRALAMLEDRGDLETGRRRGAARRPPGGAAARHRPLSVLARAGRGRLSRPRTTRRRRLAPRRARRRAPIARRRCAHLADRRADPGAQHLAAGRAGVGLARPRQDRLSEPRRADVRRALRRGRRRPAAGVTGAGRRRRRARARSACTRRASARSSRSCSRSTRCTATSTGTTRYGRPPACSSGRCAPRRLAAAGRRGDRRGHRRHPRSRPCWPVDPSGLAHALRARRLLQAGARHLRQRGPRSRAANGWRETRSGSKPPRIALARSWRCRRTAC